MTLSLRALRMNTAVFGRLGVAASWGAASGQSCSVIVHDADQIAPLATMGHGVVNGVVLRVQETEIASPSKGNIVYLASGDQYQVIAAPQLNRAGIWICEVKAL